MKICLLANAASIHTARWVDYFQYRAHEVHVISFDRPTENSQAQVHVLPAIGLMKVGYFRSASHVRSLLDQIKPDLLHAHYASGYGTLGRLSGFHPYVLSVWGADIYDFPLTSFLHRGLIRRNLAAADHLCSTSEIMADETRKYCDGPISVTPFGVDCEKFRPLHGPAYDDRPMVIGTVRSLEEKYGIEYLIRAFAQVVRRLDGLERLKLVIAGDGSRRKRLQSLASELGVASSTQFIGHVAHHKIPTLLNTFSIFAALSVHESESFGVAVLEASACGVPVVVSRIGGLTEVVRDDSTGVIVPPRDAAAASDAL